MLCQNCEADIADSAKFCAICGAAAKPAIPAVAPTIRCPKCGTENLIGAKFCKTDGYRFEHPEEPLQPPQPEPLNTVLCPACGTVNPVDAIFCKKDGVRLVENASSVPQGDASRVPTGPQAPAPQGALSAESHAAPSLAPLGPDRHPVRQGTARKWAVTVAILVALIGGGAGGYLYYAGAFIKSAELKAAIDSDLATKGILGISVDVDDDRVATLGGDIGDAAIRDAAVHVARSVRGVKDVLAKLDVLPSISDTENGLSQALKAQQLTDILVSVDEKRNATLTGTVSDAAMIDVATNTAAATSGVRSVTSQIQVTAIAPITYSGEAESSVSPQQAPSGSSSRGRRGVVTGDASGYYPPTTPSVGAQSAPPNVAQNDPVADRRWLREEVQTAQPSTGDHCDRLSGLKADQCRSCRDTEGLGKLWCEERARLRYCDRNRGTSRECPAAGQ
ncbi:MAG: BON domain-containing protein [Sulfuritalea sp.]|nr:BON domain-containing protein [Sulfuritalea sp.]